MFLTSLPCTHTSPIPVHLHFLVICTLFLYLPLLPSYLVHSFQMEDPAEVLKEEDP